MTDRPPHLDDREAAAELLVGLLRQKGAHPLRARPFGVVVMDAADDLTDLAGLAQFVVGSAQGVVEHLDAGSAGLRLHQRLHFRVIDPAHFILVKKSTTLVS